MISFSINLQPHDWPYDFTFLAGVFFFLPPAAFFVGVFLGLASAFFGDGLAFLDGECESPDATSSGVSSFTDSNDLTGDFFGEAFFAAAFFAAGRFAAAFLAGAFFAAG